MPLTFPVMHSELGLLRIFAPLLRRCGLIARQPSNSVLSANSVQVNWCNGRVGGCLTLGDATGEWRATSAEQE